MKIVQTLMYSSIITATIFSLSCSSPDAGKKKKGDTIQDTSMPGQQNDGFPYNNPNSRRDNINRDSAYKKDSINGD